MHASLIRCWPANLTDPRDTQLSLGQHKTVYEDMLQTLANAKKQYEEKEREVALLQQSTTVCVLCLYVCPSVCVCVCVGRARIMSFFGFLFPR